MGQTIYEKLAHNTKTFVRNITISFIYFLRKNIWLWKKAPTNFNLDFSQRKSHINNIQKVTFPQRWKSHKYYFPSGIINIRDKNYPIPYRLPDTYIRHFHITKLRRTEINKIPAVDFRKNKKNVCTLKAFVPSHALTDFFSYCTFFCCVHGKVNDFPILTHTHPLI